MPPAVSVIIPAYNAERTLDACLTAVCSQQLAEGDFEVILVDDASTDGTVLIAQRHGVRVLAVDHGGPASARNQGAAVATGDFLVFTDADCAPLPGWLEAMVRPLRGGEVVGSKGRYATQQRSLTARFTQVEFEEKYERLAHHRYIDFIDTYAAAYRRDVFLANGGFDTIFPTPSAEDQELSFRLAEQGHKMVFAPDAVVLHIHPVSWWPYTRRKARFGYWQVLNRLRHPTKILTDSYTPPTQRIQLVLLGLMAITVLLALLNPDWWTATGVLALFFLFTGIPLIQLAWRLDRPVAFVTPVMLVLRAAGVLAGVGLAVVTLPFSLGRGHPPQA